MERCQRASEPQDDHAVAAAQQLQRALSAPRVHAGQLASVPLIRLEPNEIDILPRDGGNDGLLEAAPPIVEVPVVGKVGDRLTTYFRDFGKIDAAISETMARSFLIELEMTRERRERLSDMLTWIEKKQQSPGTVIELRKDARFIPPVPHTTLTLADGAIHPCFIIDCSVSGVAVSSAVQPPVGMPLAVGACVGRVVRLLPNGIAVRFVEKQTIRDLDRLVARKIPAAVKVAVTAEEPVAAMGAAAG